MAHAGGELSCQLDAVFDCAAVWNAPLAKTIHRLSGLPVAGWGLVWAFAAFVAGLQIILRSDPAPAVWSARVVGYAGMLGVLALFAVSIDLGVVCPTCLATYVLVLAYAALATFGFSGGRFSSRAAIGPVVAVAVAWLTLLTPGLRTSVEPSPALPEATKGEDTPSPEAPAKAAELQALVRSLPPQGKALLAQSLESLRAEAKDTPAVAARPRWGAPDGLLVTDFSDIRCGHCRGLAAALHELESRVGDRFAEEARYFPLSSRCNPKMPKEVVDPSGVRCFAAKSLICLESHPKLPELRRDLFERQQELSVELVAERAAALLGVSRGDLEACQSNPDVLTKLAEDISFASSHGITGTPLVLLNGREISAHPVILYALILADGRPDHPAFSGL